MFSRRRFCCPRAAPRHTIEARIDGLDGDVIVGYFELDATATSDGDATLDTIRTEAGRFVYDIAADAPVQVRIFETAVGQSL